MVGMLLACYCIDCGRLYSLEASDDTADYYCVHGQGFTDDSRVPLVCPNCYCGSPLPPLRPGDSEPVLTENDMRD